MLEDNFPEDKAQGADLIANATELVADINSKTSPEEQSRRNCHTLALSHNGITEGELDYLKGTVDNYKIFGTSNQLKNIYDIYFENPVVISSIEQYKEKAEELSKYDLAYVVWEIKKIGREEIVHSFVPIKDTNKFMHRANVGSEIELVEIDALMKDYPLGTHFKYVFVARKSN